MQLNFDARTVDPSTTLVPIEAGWYPVIIIESEGKPTKANDGGYLQLTFEVIDGPHKGRKVFDRLNLQNKNQQTVEIAYKQLSAICHATGVIQMQDTQQLHGKPLLIKVSVKTDPTGNYEPSNEVKGYKAIEGGPAAGAGIGGNAAGVPSWAGQNVAATAPPAAQQTQVQQPAVSATLPAIGFNVGNTPAQPGQFGALSTPAVATTPAVAAGPAAGGTVPSWAQSAK